MFIQEPRLRLGKLSISSAKRLLQYNIGTKRTCRGGLTMSVHWGKADFVKSPADVAV
jgi:hypothetical protein